MGQQSSRKLFCNVCGLVSNHLVLHTEETRWDDEVDPGQESGYVVSIVGGGTYNIVRCLGCDEITYLTELWCSEEMDSRGGLIISPKRYPPSTLRRHPEWLKSILHLPLEIRDNLRQIYIAVQNDALLLAALGIRALIERIMVGKVEDTGSLGANIDRFFSAGFVAVNDQEQFRGKVVEVGNAAMHRAYTPTSDDINTLLDITEGLIASIYIHPKRAALVGKGMPPRLPRKA